MGLRVDVLGPLEVRGDTGELLDVDRPAHKRLLSIMALAGGGRVSTDVLIDRHWPEGAPETARAALQTHISGLRRSLGEDLIATEGYGYRLNLTAHKLDVREFEDLTRQANDLRGQGALEDALSRIESALALWRGDPFTELGDDDFAKSETVRLLEIHLELMEQRAGILISLGRIDEALPDLEALVVENPYRERLWEHLMTARYRLGRNAEALAAFQDLSAKLAEIGVEPGQPLRTLEERILLHDQFLARTGGELPDEVDVLLARFPPARWPLIGREPLIDRGVEVIESGVGTALLGVAGVGKSRLLREISERSEQVGRTVLRVLASKATSSIPYAPFVGLLPDGPTQDQLAMLNQALHRLRALAGDHGLVLAVDDAHHLDDASLAFMISVANSGAATVCLTARTGERMASDLVNLWTGGPLERLDVGPLSRSDSLAVAETRLGSISDGLAEDLWHLAEGNPLVLHEVVEGAVSGNLIHEVNGKWDSRGQLATSARLVDLVSSRVDSIPAELHDAMDIVAVGAPLTHRLLTEAAGAAVGDLEERQLIVIANAVDGQIVTTPHPLYGELLEANLSLSRRQSAAKQLAAAGLQAPGEVDVLRTAMWQYESGEILSAELAAGGAAAALARHDPVLAEQLARPVASQNEMAGSLLGRALSYQQRFEEAESVLSQLSPNEPHMNGELASIRAHNLAFGLMRIQEAREILKSATVGTLDSALKGRLNNERAMISAMTGDFGDARLATEEVLSDDASDVMARASAYATLTLAQAMTGDCAGFNAIADDALEATAAVRPVLPLVEDQVRLTLMTSLFHEGRSDDSIALGVARLDSAEPGDVLTPTWISTLSMSLISAGKLDQAVERLTLGVDLYSVADPFGLEPQARGLLALALAHQGKVESAGPIEGVQLAVPQPRLAVWLDRGRAWSLVTRGELEAAKDILVGSARNAVAGEHFAWATMCMHDLVRLGDPDRATDLFAQLPTMDGAHLLETMRLHQQSLASNVAAGLAGVAERFASHQAWLLAAEAWAQASAVNGTERSARASYVSLSRDAESKCEGADTPALRSRLD